MINCIYLNDLSLNGLDSKNQIEILFNRLRKLVVLLNLENLPDLNFIVDIFSSKEEDEKITFIDLVSQLEHDISSYLYSQLQSSHYEEITSDTGICSYESEDISVVATYLNHHSIDAILFSFATHTNWDNTRLNFNVDGMETINFRHIGEIDDKTDWILEAVQQNNAFADAEEFIQKLPSRYINLQFNSSSLEQIRKIDTDVAKLARLDRCFTILDAYCAEDWTSSFRIDEINELGVKLRGESESTRTNTAYMNERKFKDLNGKSVQFELHFDITKAERCYILPLHAEKKILVGYVGGHLSTTKHN